MLLVFFTLSVQRSGVEEKIESDHQPMFLKMRENRRDKIIRETGRIMMV